MAERTGDPKLDDLIVGFLNQNETSVEEWFTNAQDQEEQYFKSLDEMRTPEGSRGWCSILAGDFTHFLTQHGAKAWHSSEERWSDFHPDELGYGDRPINDPDQRCHCVTMVERNGRKFMVDWTAAQYGYSEFPLVQWLDKGQWVR